MSSLAVICPALHRSSQPCLWLCGAFDYFPSAAGQWLQADPTSLCLTPRQHVFKVLNTHTIWRDACTIEIQGERCKYCLWLNLNLSSCLLRFCSLRNRYFCLRSAFWENTVVKTSKWIWEEDVVEMSHSLGEWFRNMKIWVLWYW